VSRQLDQAGLRTAAIHGDRSQAQRERALEAFHRGQIDALIATDVAARGIHVDGVCAVVHLDPPADEKDYVHRSGRTGRAGAEGIVVTFVAPELRKDVTRMQKILKMTSGITSPDADGLPVLTRPERKVRAVAPRHEESTHSPRAGRPGAKPTRRTGAPRRGSSSGSARDGERYERSERPARADRSERSERPARAGKPSPSSRSAKPARAGRPGQATPQNPAGNRQSRRAHLQADGGAATAGSRKSRRSAAPNPDKGKRRQPSNPR